MNSTAAFFTHCLETKAQTRIVHPVLKAQIQFATPIRIFPTGAGQIDLLALTEYILHLNRHYLRRRASQVTMDGTGEFRCHLRHLHRIGTQVFGQQLLVFQRQQQACAIPGSSY